MSNSTTLVPAWTAETAPRRGNPGGFTRNERRFRRARDKELVPEAMGVLRDMLVEARTCGDPAVRQRARMDFMKCLGLIQKPTDSAMIRELAEKLIDEMLAEADRRAGARREG